jgi:hypothetical protein
MKSKFLTFLLSVLPGVGHLYLGLLTRGLHFMILFFGSIFLIILIGIEELIILLPIIWFYSLFDALQKYELLNEGIVEDVPLFLLDKVQSYQKGMAYLLIGVGGYLLLEKILSITHFFSDSWFFIDQFRVIVVALVLIFIGFRLLRTVHLPSPTTTLGDPSHKGEDEHD